MKFINENMYSHARFQLCNLPKDLCMMFSFASTVILRIFCCRGDRLSRLIFHLCFLNPLMQIPKEYPKFHHDGYLSNPSQVMIYFHPIIFRCKLSASATADSVPGDFFFLGGGYLPARAGRLIFFLH